MKIIAEDGAAGMGDNQPRREADDEHAVGYDDTGPTATPDHVVTTLAKLLDCCEGSRAHGATACICWARVDDLEQQPLEVNAKVSTREHMCVDCAYRPNSPEKSGDASYRADADELERIAACDEFWCHEGIRKPVRWRHPAGIEIDGHPGGYDPPIVGCVPHKADGSPAELCAGWDARRRALSAARG